MVVGLGLARKTTVLAQKMVIPSLAGELGAGITIRRGLVERPDTAAAAAAEVRQHRLAELPALAVPVALQSSGKGQ